ncbi:type II toxin-antitoxin system PemK/MazF family toxin [Arthrobacter woluwensis]|uniref:type II toxin-antitoxin system PemK/MazF family toxin n=1 Tax=Arthrobacter woluwensis TaxID=156980 RepID=UPI003805F9D0
MTELDLAPGVIAWATLSPIKGREQGGHRPVLIISSTEYLEAVTTMVIALPITTTDRGWPNHVPVEGPSGLDRRSWIMTEQPRTLSRERITGVAGRVTPGCLATTRLWLRDFLNF